MDGQDHKIPVTSAGHEVHGVHLCLRCGWPFPNPHPSAKHRRTHKRVCGKIEGYRISQSDFTISDDEHDSDEDEQHTPSPKIVKSNTKDLGSDGGVRERSNKSEDDVFSDAATEFSDSGISPSLEERLEIIKGDDRKIKQNSLEGNNNVNTLKKVDESSETTKKLNNPIRSDQMYTGSEAVPFELGDHLQSDDTKYDSQKNVHIQVEGDNSASVSLNSREEEKASDPSLMAAERKDEPHYKLDGITHVSDVTNFTVVEDKPAPDDIRVTLAGESDIFLPTETSGDNVDSSNENCSVATVSIPVLHNSSVPEDDSTTRVLEENTNHNDEKANCELSVAGSESGKGAPMEEKVILDLSKPSVNSTDLLPSGEVDVDPKQLESLSKTDSTLLEFKDVEFMRSRQGVEASNVTGLDIGLNLDAPVVVGVKSVGVPRAVDKSNRDSDVEVSEKTQEQPISKDSTNPRTESLVTVEKTATNNSFTNNVPKTSEFIDVALVDTEQKHDGRAAVLPENSDSSPSKVQDTSSVKEKCLHGIDSDKSHATEDFNMPESVCIVETPDKILVSTLSPEPVSSPLHSQISNANSSNDDKKTSGTENATVVDSKSLDDEGDSNDKMINEKHSVSATDSLEGKWGSISGVETNSQSSPKSETNMQNSKPTNIKGHQSKSDDFEPPSFMTLVQYGKELDSVAAPTTSEIEPVQNNQQQKSGSLQAVWFPSLTNVVNDSQGRKKNEEIIAKVTNWKSGKEHHGQLKNLLNEAKSTNTKQQKDETSPRDNGAAGRNVSSVVEPEEPKPETPHKEDWNSPARYPTVIKKEKKKGKPYWVPFVCCSSVNRDL